MTPNEIAINVAKDYLRQLEYTEVSLKIFFSNAEAYQHSVQKWAVKEVIRELKAHMDIPPLATLEELARTWDRWSVDRPGEAVRLIFSIGKDTVVTIIDYLIN